MTPLPPVTPPVWHDSLLNLTETEKEEVRDSLPTDEELKIGWALPVLRASESERRIMVGAQIEVLSVFEEDPKGWCREALRLAGKEGVPHAER
jgi:hypothetical protein